MKVNPIKTADKIIKVLPENKVQEMIFNDPILGYNEKYILNLSEWEEDNKRNKNIEEKENKIDYYV